MPYAKQKPSAKHKPPSQAGKPRSQADRRPPKAMTAQSLENRALYYLERFSATKQGLRQTLVRKMKRHAGDAYDAVVASEMIDALVLKLEASGWVNDARFAESRTATLARRGGSRRVIAMKLRGKGVSAELVSENIAGLDDEEAALAFAKRKRLGPFRQGETTQERARKDIAAMARGGFSYGVIKKALAPG